MLLLKRWKCIWMLPCALLQLMPDRAAAQSAPMTEIEKGCVAIAAEDAVQYNEAFRQTFNETVRRVQEQRCPPNPDWMTLPETFAMQPLLPMLRRPCSPSCLHVSLLSRSGCGMSPTIFSLLCRLR